MKNPAYRIALIYCAICATYIVLSDLLVLNYFVDSEHITLIQTIKGTTFVILSAALIFWLVCQNFKQIKKANNELKESIDYHKLIFDKSPLPGFIIDIETLEYKRVNEAAEIKLFRKKEDYLKAKAADFVKGLSKEELIHTFLNIGETGYSELFVEAVNGRGKSILEHVFCQNIIYKGRQSVLMLVLDVTSIQQNETVFMDRMLDLLDEERFILASEIHDGVKQYFGLANGMIKTFREKFYPSEKENEILKRIEEITEMGIQDCKSLSNRLVPAKSIIDFKGSLYLLVENLNFLKQTKFHLEFDLSKEYHEDLIKNTFRIIQECCRNIRVHAHAQNAYIKLCEKDESLHLEIIDDGVGFDPVQSVHSMQNFGMTTMRSRAAKMNGTFLMNSEPGFGTKISVTIPAKFSKSVA